MASLKRRLMGRLLLAALLTMLPLIVAQAQCPDSSIYVGGPVVTDANAVRGSEDNPAADIDEAFQICASCPNGANVWRYNAQQGKYLYRGSCVPEAEEPTGVLLAQPVVMGLLGVIAVGAIVWGTYLRLRLKRMTEGR